MSLIACDLIEVAKNSICIKIDIQRISGRMEKSLFGMHGYASKLQRGI